jgi:hypothetical protein
MAFLCDGGRKEPPDLALTPSRLGQDSENAARNTEVAWASRHSCAAPEFLLGQSDQASDLVRNT